jgi:hexokinase
MFIGILTLFFALETMLVEQQFFRMLARLIGRHVARLSTCGITAIATRDGASRRAVSRGCGGSSYDVHFRYFYFYFSSRVYALTPGRHTKYLRSG